MTRASGRARSPETAPLSVSFEAPGRAPVVVTFRGRQARGIRELARTEGLPEAEAAAALLRLGLGIVQDREAGAHP